MSVNSFVNYKMNWKPSRDELGEGPIYLALAALLERDVESGKLPTGTKLPPQRELADYLDLNFTTVTRAYDLCREKGLIYGITGRGTFVSSRTSDPDDSCNGCIDLGVIQGFPEVGVQDVVDAGSRVLSRAGASELFSYARRDGYGHHLEAGRRWLARDGIDVEECNLAVFPGVQSSLSTALLSLFRVGDGVATDEFTYANLVHLAHLAHIRLVPVAGDGGGMLPGALDDAVVKKGLKGVFLMPDCANPTSITLDDERRRLLAKVIRTRDLILLEDNSSLSLGGRSSLRQIIPERTVYFSGSTRIVAPGLRVSYIAFPSVFRDKLLEGLHHVMIKASSLEAEILGELILSGVAESIVGKKIAKARSANRLFDSVFPGEVKDGTRESLFRRMPLEGFEGKGKEVERALLDAGVRAFHSDRFRVGRKSVGESFLRVSVSSAGSLSRLRTGLGILARFGGW